MCSSTTCTPWANEMRRTDRKPRDQMLAEIKQYLEREYGVALLGGLGFENGYALAMPRALRGGARHQVHRRSHAPCRHADAGGRCRVLRRPEWAAIRDGYGLSFRAQRQSVRDLHVCGGRHRAKPTYSCRRIRADGRIAQQDLAGAGRSSPVLVLPLIAVLLVARSRASDAALLNAPAMMLGAIDVTRMRAKPTAAPSRLKARRTMGKEVEAGG